MRTDNLHFKTISFVGLQEPAKIDRKYHFTSLSDRNNRITRLSKSNYFHPTEIIVRTNKAPLASLQHYTFPTPPKTCRSALAYV